jgi:signal transduction histidine kinase
LVYKTAYCSIFCCIFLQMPQYVFSQPLKRLNSFSYNVNEGLSQSHVIDIAEDGNGFMWLSTGSGVQRFDGNVFHNITAGTDKKDLPEDKYVHFFKLRNGNLWLSHSKGITQYDIKTNTFHSVYEIKNRNNIDIPIVACEDGSGVWFWLANEGLIYLDKKDFSVKGNIQYNLPSLKNLTATFPTREIIVVAGNKAVVKLTGEAIIFDLRLKTADLWQPDLSQGYFYSFEQYTDDSLLVASSRGIEKIGLTTKKSGGIYPVPFTDQGSLWASVHMRKIKDNLFIVSSSTELFELDTKEMKYVSHLVNLQNQSFLNIGFVNGFIMDSFKNLWVLSINDGIRKINYNFSGFRYFGTPEKKNNFVKSIFVDKEANLIFCGTYNSGLLLYDSTEHLIRHIVSFPGVPAPASVLAIKKRDPDHYFIFLMNAWDVFLLNTKNFSMERVKVHVKVTSFLVKPDYYTSLLRVNDSVTLLQAFNSLFKINFLANKELHFKLLDTINSASICAYADHHHNVWIGAPGKYFYLPADRSGIKQFDLSEKILCRCFLQDDSERIWLGTEKGLFQLNTDGTIKKGLLKKDGLVDDGIYAMQEDNAGNIWVSHNKGLTRISPAGSFLHFNKNDGLQENEFNTNTSFKTPDGELFFGGVNGISSFYPALINNLSEIPRVMLSGIKIKDQSWNDDTAYWSIEKLELPYKNNIISFEFSALGLRNPDQYNYQYRLAGVDADWVNAGNNPSAKYSLSPGHYTFYYYAANTFEPSPRHYKELTITIHPPLWQKWWFIALLILLAGALISGMATYITRQRFRRKMKALQLQQEIQHERERISRELHDNIGAQLSYISSNIDWMMDVPLSKEEENKRMTAVNETAKNVMHNLRETIWALNRESIYIDELADKLKLFIQQQLHVNGKIINSFDENYKTPVQLTPNEALNIYRICQEAISNAIKHSGCTALNIKLESYSPSNFMIEIADNGKGFDTGKEYPQHYGLVNMQHRVGEAGIHLKIVNDGGTKVILTK